jgi:molybdenum cofactor cytidylyltransferase
VREVAAIILAAGRSERMGAFKPLLPFGPTTVIESCVNYLSDASIETIVVVAGYKAAELKSALNNRPVEVVVNPIPHSQMNSSIACGIGSVPPDARALLIALADHPAVSAEVVKDLVTNWEAGELILKPTWNGRGGHPVLVDLQFRHELENLDDKGLKGFFQTHQRLVTRVPVSSPYVARDMDTWDDYLTLHTEVFGKQPTAGWDK